MAGVAGLEPAPKVLETSMLTIDTIPLYINGKLKVEMENSIRYSPFSILHSQLLVFLMQRVTAAAAAELFELEPVGRVLFVLCRHVVALFALRALQNNVISRHNTSRSLF